MHVSLFKHLRVLLIGMLLTVPSLGWSNTVAETPAPLAMTSDALFVRPVMMVTTVLGAGIFIISSPFSALGGNIDEAWDTLVVSPFETTFVRCLGCTLNGRKASETIEQEAK